MDIKELKNKIELKILNDSPLILKYEDNKFLCYHYINAIARDKNLTKLNINSINEISNDDNSFFEETSHYLYVLDVEVLNDAIMADYKNLIVVTKEIKKDSPVDFTEIPKLLNWQIEDFMKMRLPGLSEEEILWLCKIANYNIYRLDFEASKLEIFPSGQQKILFQELNADNAYCDLNPLNIFNFTNAVIKKDLNTLNDILSNLRYIDIEGVGLISIFTKNIKNIIDIQMNPYATADSLEMSPKQFAAIKYNVGKFSNQQLINMFDFLTSLDLRLKRGDLQFKSDNKKSNVNLIDYITSKLLYLGSTNIYA